MKQPGQSAHVPSLIDVQLAFAQWRKTRTVRGPTPHRLRRLAVGLLEKHRAVAVYKALDLNAATLKQWEKPHSDAASKGNESEDFIALPTGSLANQAPHCVSIALPNGVQVRVQGAYTLSELLLAASELSANA